MILLYLFLTILAEFVILHLLEPRRALWSSVLANSISYPLALCVDALFEWTAAEVFVFILEVFLFLPFRSNPIRDSLIANASTALLSLILLSLKGVRV